MSEQKQANPNCPLCRGNGQIVHGWHQTEAGAEPDLEECDCWTDMAVSSTVERTPIVTEIKETEAFGYHISLSNDSLYVSPKKPIDDGDEVVAAFCETWKADRDRIQSLEAALEEVTDYFSEFKGYNESTQDMMQADANCLIDKARAALGQKGDA